MSSKSDKDATLRNDLNKSFEQPDLSPITLHGVPSHSKISLANHKHQQFYDKLKEQERTRRVTKVIGVTAESLNYQRTVNQAITKKQRKKQRT